MFVFLFGLLLDYNITLNTIILIVLVLVLVLHVCVCKKPCDGGVCMGPLPWWGLDLRISMLRIRDIFGSGIASIKAKRRSKMAR